MAMKNGLSIFLSLVAFSYLTQSKRILKEADKDDILVKVREQKRRLDYAHADDFLVTSLPGLKPEDFKTKHYAGFIEVDKENDGNVFYWLFEASKEPNSAPLVIWLNGGPGCSSLDGLFLELGPFRIKDDEKTIEIEENSWHHAANLLFIDQPVGTGLSYVSSNGFLSSGNNVTASFRQFLIKFFKRHNNFITSNNKTRDIYIFGESYSGRYLPLFANNLLNNPIVRGEVDFEFIVKGIGIGNGWIHPLVQYDYSDYAHAIGLISLGQKNTLQDTYKHCQKKLLQGSSYSQECFANLDTILKLAANPRNQGKKVNYYDVRQYVANPSVDFPPNRGRLITYINQPQVRIAIHAKTSHRFVECSSIVFSSLVKEDGISTVNEIQSLLDKKIQVLIYNGQWDMMCNHLATEKFLDKLQWSNASEYHSSKKFTWITDGIHAPSGYVKEGGGLTFIIVSGSGHMVPMDVPEVALDMLRRFIHGIKFNDVLQNLIPSLMNDKSNLCNSSTAMKPFHEEAPITGWWIAICVGSSIISCILTTLVITVYIRAKANDACRHVNNIEFNEDEVNLKGNDEDVERILSSNNDNFSEQHIPLSRSSS